MTFLELDRILKDTGRIGYATSMLACLLDAFDRGETILEKETVASLIDITDTNVAAVARRLAESGVIEILYCDKRADKPTYSTISNGRWATPYYQLTSKVLKAYRRA